MRKTTIRSMTAFARATIEDPAELSEVEARLAGHPATTRRDKLLTSKEAAAIAGVHPKTLLGWARRGWLSPRRITRRRIRFSRAELEQFLCETTEG